MVVVVGVATVVGYEGFSDAEGYMGWHVVVEMLGHADRHADGLVVAVLVATAFNGWGVKRADAGGDGDGGVDVTAYQPAQTMLVAGAAVVETHQIGFGFFLEQFFLIFHRHEFVMMVQR